MVLYPYRESWDIEGVEKVPFLYISREKLWDRPEFTA